MKKICRLFTFILAFVLGLACSSDLITIFAQTIASLETMHSYSFTINENEEVIFNGKLTNSLFSENISVSITDYTYYLAEGIKDELLYIVADVYEQENPNQTHVAKISFYDDECINTADPEFELEYFDKDSRTLYMAYGEVDQDIIDIIREDAETINMFGSSDTAQRLEHSVTFNKQFQKQIYEENQNNDSRAIVAPDWGETHSYYYDANGQWINVVPSNDTVFANEEETVVIGAFDSYCNNKDNIVADYIEHYVDTNWDDDPVGDDPIVQLIPKDLFFHPGNYGFIGKYYGFYVQVHAFDNPNVYGSYYADTYVFNVEERSPGYNGTNEGYIRLTPMFQFSYTCIVTANEDWQAEDYPFDTTLDKLVLLDDACFVGFDFSIRNVKFKSTIMSTTSPNYCTPGYDVENSTHDYFTNVQYNLHGQGMNAYHTIYELESVNFYYGGELGYTPMISTVKDGYDAYCVESASTNWPMDEIEWNENEHHFADLYELREDQIENYEYPVNSVFADIVSTNDVSPFYQIIEDRPYYVEFRYSTSAGDADSTETKIWHAIDLEIWEDATYWLEYNSWGHYNKLSSLTSCYSYGTYMSEPRYLEYGCDDGGYISKAGTHNFFEVEINHTSNYELHISSSLEIFAEIYDPEGNIIATGTYYNEEGEWDIATYVDLTAGNSYVIKVGAVGATTGYFDIMLA